MCYEETNNIYCWAKVHLEAGVQQGADAAAAAVAAVAAAAVGAAAGWPEVLMCRAAARRETRDCPGRTCSSRWMS